MNPDAPEIRTRFGALLGVVLVASVLAMGYFLSDAARSAQRLSQIREGSFNADDAESLGLLPTIAEAAIVDANGRRDVVAAVNQTALVLIFNTKCIPCNGNMPRWIDLIGEVRRADPKLRIVVLSQDEPSLSVQYWRRLAPTLLVAKPVDLDATERALGPLASPTTIVVRGGRVTAVIRGTIGPHRRSYIVRRLFG